MRLKTTQNTKQLFKHYNSRLYILVAAILLAITSLVDPGWRSTADFHTLMELAATLLSLIIGIISLIRYFTEKDDVFLFIGVGFLGTGFLDGYHAIVTSIRFIDFYPSTPSALIPWSWNASRTFLSILMILSYWVWVRPQSESIRLLINDQRLIGFLSLLLLSIFLFFIYAPLPSAYYPDSFFGRPADLIPAFIFLLALWGFYTKAEWREESFEYWLVLSLLINVICQFFYMPFSRQIFDGMFDVAHLLKVISYACVMIGLLVSFYQLHRRYERTTINLQDEVEHRHQAEQELSKNITLLEQQRLSALNVTEDALHARQQALASNEKLKLALDELNLTKETLVKNKIFLDAVLDNMEEGVVACDANGALSYFNQATVDFHGKEVEQLPPEQWSVHFDLFHADGKTLLRADEVPLYRAYHGDYIDGFEMVIAPKKGKRRFVICYGQEIHSTDDQRLGAVVTMHDITESKTIELELRESEQRLHTIFEAAPNGLAIIALDGRWIRVNPAMCKILGYTKQEFLDTNYKDLTHPDDVEEQARLIDQLLTGEIDQYSYEKRNIHKDGHYVWVMLNATLIRDADSQPLYLLSQVFDMSEQKLAEENRNQVERYLRESEERFRSTFESAPNGLAIVGLDGKWLRINPAMCKMLGYTKQEFLDTDIKKFTHPDDFEGQAKLIDQLLVGEIDGYSYEKRYVHKQGHTIWIMLNVSLVRDFSGEPQYFVSQIQDLTAEKAAEAEREEQKQLLVDKLAAENANKAKSQFLANMSHELRTPLNAIIGYSEMLSEEAEEAEQTQTLSDLEKINSSGKHLLGLINDILDISKIEAGKMEVMTKDFSVRDLLYEVSSTMQTLVKKNNNIFHIDYSHSDIVMRSDAQKIRQILFNLISNAAKFTSDGEISLSVQSMKKNDSDKLEFIIKDSGIGMTDNQLKRVFSAFTQADGETTRKYGGTGLGLAITERFCHMLGGDIHVSSEPDKGTVFTVSLPIILDEENMVETDQIYPASIDSKFNKLKEEVIRSIPLSSNDIATMSLGNKTDMVLVIDDDLNAIEVLSFHLRKSNFNVVSSDNGMDGVLLAQELKPKVIILDLMMPHMNGWAVLKMLKANPETSSIPVIMCSMVTEQREAGFALGATDYLIKPVDKNSLNKVLERFHSNSTKNLLVVEDDDAIRELIVRTAQEQTWQVDSAVNGFDALTKLSQKLPDLILLDLMMPEMDGFQLIEKLQQNGEWSEIPVIIMTAKDLSKADYDKLNGYVEVILEKGGCTNEELIAQINRQINSIKSSALH